MCPLALSFAPFLISFLVASVSRDFASAFLSARYPVSLVPWTSLSRSSCLSVSLTTATFLGAAFFVAAPAAAAFGFGVPAFDAVAALTAGAGFAAAAAGFVAAAAFFGAAFV